jgi:hypothetical protein
MTDAELIARMLDGGVLAGRMIADRIEFLAKTNEALTAERDMATEGWAEATRLIDVARQQYGAEKSRAEAAEAKLAKAVERLTNMRDDQTGYRHVSHFRRGAAVTLAEIESSFAAPPYGLEGEK